MEKGSRGSLERERRVGTLVWHEGGGGGGWFIKRKERVVEEEESRNTYTRKAPSHYQSFGPSKI